MKKAISFMLLALTLTFGATCVCLGQTSEFKYIEPRSNMLGQCIVDPKPKGLLYTFRLNPINSLKLTEIKDSIVQVGADTASIVSTLQNSLNLSFLKRTKGYELKIHPSKIKIIYLGPETLTSTKAKGKNLVIGVAYSKSLTISLEQTIKTDIDYKKAANLAIEALQETVPGLTLAKQVIGAADSLNSSKTRKVVGLWRASDKNLVYGVATATIQDLNPTLGNYSRPFAGKKSIELTLATKKACSSQASPIYETGIFNKNQDGDPYQLCYKIVAGKPELVVVDANTTDKIVLVIPRQIGLNGPENTWSGNYYLDTQPRRNGAAMQMVFISVEAHQKNPNDPRTIVVDSRDEDGNLATCISYPMYLLAATK